MWRGLALAQERGDSDSEEAMRTQTQTLERCSHKPGGTWDPRELEGAGRTLPGPVGDVWPCPLLIPDIRLQSLGRGTSVVCHPCAVLQGPGASRTPARPAPPHRAPTRLQEASQQALGAGSQQCPLSPQDGCPPPTAGPGRGQLPERDEELMLRASVGWGVE